MITPQDKAREILSTWSDKDATQRNIVKALKREDYTTAFAYEVAEIVGARLNNK